MHEGQFKLEAVRITVGISLQEAEIVCKFPHFNPNVSGKYLTQSGVNTDPLLNVDVIGYNKAVRALFDCLYLPYFDEIVDIINNYKYAS